MPATLDFFTKRCPAKVGALILAITGIWLVTGLLQRAALSPTIPIAVVELKLPVKRATSSLDFGAIEKHLAAIHTDDTQDMEVTAEFDKKLSMVVTTITNHTGTNHTGTFPEPIRVLIEKSFPGANGGSLAALVECYFYYKQAETQVLNEVEQAASISTGSESQSPANLGELQAAYFGEALSRVLFSDYHRLYQQLNASKPLDNAPATPSVTPGGGSSTSPPYSVVLGSKARQQSGRTDPQLHGNNKEQADVALDAQLGLKQTPPIPAIHEQACAPLSAAIAH